MTDETIFAAALEKADPAERAAFLAEVCPEPGRRGHIEALLAAHARAGDFLEPPPAADAEHAPTRMYTPPEDADTMTPDRPDDGDVLSFLDPPGRPESLGRLGHYEVLQVLGRGGFGIVFRALDTVLERVVAVKVMAPQLAATSPARKRFLREARAAAAVRHDHVVRVYAVEELPLPYLVMEFIPGETLQQRLDRHGPLDVPEVLRLGRQVAEGLAAAHAGGLVHRDVKPGNVMIEAGPHGRVKLTDFGLARAADDASISASGVVAGTPMYMAPEQAKGDALDHRADLFGLGSMLYVMCSGRPPFRANSTLAVLKRVVEDTPRPIREIIPEVPEWLCRVIGRLHAKAPVDRYQSAREVADVLADSEAQVKAHGALRDFSRIPGGRPRRPRRVAAWAAVALLLPLLAWGVYALTRPAPRTDPPADPPAAGAPDDKARLQGRWRLVSAEYDGRQVPAAELFQIVDWVEFHGDRQTGYWKGNEVTAAFTLNPAADPREMDILTPNGQTVRAVYRFDGDRLVFAAAELGKARPAGFRSTPGDRVFLGTYVRDTGPPAAQAPPPAPHPGEPRLQAALAVAQTKRDAVKARYDAGLEHAGTLAAAEIDLIEARLAVAAAEEDAARVVALHEELVTQREEVRRVVAEQVKAGVQRPDALAEADARLADARARLARARPPAPAPAPAAPPRPAPPAAATDMPFDTARAKAYQAEWARYHGLGGAEFADRTLGMEFRVIPPGTFRMGAADEDLKPMIEQLGLLGPPVGPIGVRALRAETPQREVRLTRAFALGKYEVTVGQFRKFVEAEKYVTTAEGGRGWGYKDEQLVRGRDAAGRPYSWQHVGYAQPDRAPVWNVSHDDAVQFCKWLGRQDGKTYRLPTEAEWEWACRAGTTGRTYWRDTGAAADYAWGVRRAHKVPVPVGGKWPNAFGLYDMCGNVWEWCADWYGEAHYQETAAAAPLTDPTGPRGPDPRDIRVQRGGGVQGGNYGLSSTGRSLAAQEVCGFRVVCELAAP